MTGYETRDIRFAAIAKGFGGVALMLALVALVSWGVLGLLSRRAPPGARASLPPEPRLQADPVEDLRRMRAEEDAVLNDGAPGVLPINRAMALLLRRGLPTRAASARTTQ